MVDLAESSRPIDMITLVEELDRHKELEAVGDVVYVSSLIDGVRKKMTRLCYGGPWRSRHLTWNQSVPKDTIFPKTEQRNLRGIPSFNVIRSSFS
jgi:hypothetical protein